MVRNPSSSQYLLIKPDDDNNCDQSPHNQTVTLQCQVTGHPSPVISWYHNGELVNFTDYLDNTTIIVENNTWTLQGGDPCNLIGYWQCFATNNVETIHSTTRVLPFGEYHVTYSIVNIFSYQFTILPRFWNSVQMSEPLGATIFCLCKTLEFVHTFQRHNKIP